MDAIDALMVFKAADIPEGATLVADDVPALKVLAAWRLCPLSAEFPSGAAPDNEADRWDWLWQNVEPNYEMLSDRSGVQPESFVADKVLVLQTARLIFPDGTISGMASKILAARIASELRIRPKKRG
jgi:hypothetical protein